MKRTRQTTTRRGRLLLACASLAAWGLIVETARACSVCGGDPQSNMVQGALSGVLVMVLVTYGLLMGFVAMGVMWFVRARRFAITRTSASEPKPPSTTA